MPDTNQQKRNSTFWGIADQLGGAMDADDFRDYVLYSLVLRPLLDNCEAGETQSIAP